MVALDNLTLCIVSFVISTILGIVFYTSTDRNDLKIRYWNISNMLCALGFLIFPIQKLSFSFITILLPNLFIVSSIIFKNLSFSILNFRKQHYRYYVLFLLIYVIATFYDTVINNNLPLRIDVHMIAIIVLMLLNLIETISLYKTYKNSFFHLLFINSFALIIFCLKIIYTSSQYLKPPMISSTDYTLAFLILSQITIQVIFNLLFYFIVFSRNEFELKKRNEILDEDATKFRKVIESAPFPIFISSVETNTILYANKLAEQAFCIEHESIIGENVSTIYAIEDEKNKILSTLDMQGYVTDYEVWMKNRVGIKFCALLSINYLDFDNQKALFTSFNDITEIKILQNDIIKSKNEAESANKSKSEFIANISHEVRTPLNSILGFSELISNSSSDHKIKGFANTIHTSGTALLTLLNDILDISKIEAGKLRIEYVNCNVKKVIDEIVAFFNPKASSKNIEILLELPANFPLTITFDEIRLRQILLNIVGNAVKFTEKGFIKITVCVSIKNDTCNMDIAIQDTGIGIKQEELDLIYTLFSQSGRTLIKYGGSGLGLTISKRLTEMLNGKISVSSKEGEGTIFNISFNNIKIANNLDDSLAVLRSSKDIFGAKILIIDDFKPNRKLITNFLKDFNIITEEANNGLEAIRKLEHFKPDLIITDLRMPEMDGHQTATHIKKILKLNTPIIAMTASSQDEDLDNHLFDGFLFKPITQQTFISAIFNFLNKLKKQNIQLNYCPIKSEFEISQDGISVLSSSINNIYPRIKNMLQYGDIEEISTFSLELKEIIKRHNNEGLRAISEQLAENLEIYNIEKIKFYLSELIKMFNLANSDRKD